MKLWKYLVLKIKKPAKPSNGREDLKEGFLERYASFQKLLVLNNIVLELMADMEGKLSGGVAVERREIENECESITEKVKAIIGELNVLSGNKYSALNDRFSSINSNIEKLVARKKIPETPYVMPLHSITREMADRLGGKNSNLGEIKNSLGIPTPDGFAISASAFREFMDGSRLIEKVQNAASEMEGEDTARSHDLWGKIQEEILKAEIPDVIKEDISKSYQALSERIGRKVSVSVRSSALLEDGEVSFAGQYATFLNVPPEHILEKYKEVVASLYKHEALSYCKAIGLRGSDMVMSVGVFEMIDAEAGGVIYTRDPNAPGDDALIITAVRGLGKSLVEGGVTPETYKVSKNTLKVLEKNVPEQVRKLMSKPGGGVEEVFLSADERLMPCIGDEQVKVLSQIAASIERHYGSPQDIEWVLSKAGALFIVQTRPLMLQPSEAHRPAASVIKGYPVLLDKGIVASSGIGFGKTYVITPNDDLKRFPEHAVLVAKHTSTRYVTVMRKASAIVTDVGAATVHMASLAREFRVPMIVDTGFATEILRTNQEITVDAVNCIVYEGTVKELAEFADVRGSPLKYMPFLNLLKDILQWIVPLHLVNPGDEMFLPEYCETFHDITRFAHQKAMQEIFIISKDVPEDVQAVKFHAAIPLDIHAIDLGGGIKGKPEKFLPEHVASLPFKSFFRGLSTVEWPEPRHVDIRGFLGMIAHSASIPEAELEQAGEKSFLFISHNYMNFSIRLGYHLSVVEAYTGGSINENYIRFFFTGGGADMERRRRRVELIRNVLEKLDFAVKVRVDVIDAVITKYESSFLERKLEILGKLTAYTKQLDAVLYDEKSAGFYLQKFAEEYID